MSGLEQHTQYFFKVKASNIRGESRFSEEVLVQTNVDVAQIPPPDHVQFELSTNTAFFRVASTFLPLVANVELEKEDGSWAHYDAFALKDSAYGEMNIDGKSSVNNLRVRLCLESNGQLCGPYAEASMVEVRSDPLGGASPDAWVIAVIIVIVVVAIIAMILIVKCCCCRSQPKKPKSRPHIVHGTPSSPPPYPYENKGVDTMKDADEVIKNNLYSTGGQYGQYNASAAQYPNGNGQYNNAFPQGEQNSNSNSNSANGGSVNSQVRFETLK